MNANALAKHYDRLEPEERFRLIHAANARGDDAELNRLQQTAPALTLSCSHHQPWAQAFHELSMLVYLELIEEAARHHDAFERWCDADDLGEEHEDEDEESDEWEIPEPAALVSGTELQSLSISECMLGLYYAQGFMLRTRIAGWKLFCERLTLPPFELWKLLPGFDRLQRAIDLVEDNDGRPPAFSPEEMVRWLNQVRRDGKPEATLESLISPGRTAANLESALRRAIEWFGGAPAAKLGDEYHRRGGSDA